MRIMGILDNFMLIYVSYFILIEEDEVIFVILFLQQVGFIIVEELRDGSDIVLEDVDEIGLIIICDCFDEENIIESVLDRFFVEIYGYSDLYEYYDLDKENMFVYEMFLFGLGSIILNLLLRFNELRYCFREFFQILCSVLFFLMYQSFYIFIIFVFY